MITAYLSFWIIEQSKPKYELIAPEFSKEKVPINECEPCEDIGGPPNCPFFSDEPNSTSVYDGIKVCIPATRIKINSHGFRDWEYSPEKTHNVFRVIIIGDSYTLGYGIELNDTYPKVLEKLLNKRKDGWTYEVLNFGVVGYEMFDKVELLKGKGLFFNPDLLIVQYEGTDIMNSTERGRYRDQLVNEYLLEHNISIEELNISIRLELEHKAHELYLDELRKKEIRPIIEEPLDHLADIISKEKVSLLVLLVHTPDRDKLILKEIARKYAWGIVDCNKYSKQEFWIHEKDGHLNPQGNQLIAEEIYKKLIENELLP